MVRYLRAAFFVRPRLPLLGRLPLNLLAVAGVVILGVGEPALWLLGAGLEVAFLYALSSSATFRRAVDAADAAAVDPRALADAERRQLLSKLDDASQARYQALEERAERVLEAHRDGGSLDGLALVDTHRESLDQLSWTFLKLLVARDHLRATDAARATEDSLRERAAKLEGELTEGSGASDESGDPERRAARQARLEALRRRIEQLTRREQLLEQIDDDLLRVETEVDTALENAVVTGRGNVSSQIDLASRVLDDNFLFGDTEHLVAAADRMRRTARS